MSLNLTVTVDGGSGFCFGVDRAIARAEEIIRSGETLYCLGQIVHNEEEVRRLEELGMLTIRHEDLKNLHNQKILIRAHGEPPSTYEMIRRNGNIIIDGSCPIVLKLQDRVKKSNESGDFVMIFGKPGHPELNGLVGQTGPDILVFERFSDLNIKELPPRVTLYSQTTMSIHDLYEVQERLVAAGIEVDLKDTVCRQVSGREEKLADFCREHDVIIFVSGKKSSNGMVLFQVCKDANHRSYLVSRMEELNHDWFHEGERVGVAGATSTPAWQLTKIKNYLFSL